MYYTIHDKLYNKQHDFDSDIVYFPFVDGLLCFILLWVCLLVSLAFLVKSVILIIEINC